jgi:hypothetical protein
MNYNGAVIINYNYITNLYFNLINIHFTYLFIYLFT